MIFMICLINKIIKKSKNFFLIFPLPIEKKIVSLHLVEKSSVSLCKFLSVKSEKFQKGVRISVKTLAENAGELICSYGIFSEPHRRVILVRYFRPQK